MAHLEQKEYCLSVKERFPDFFQKKLILDIGALDINGNNQYLFDECGYWGVDISPGRNIDIVSKGHELNLPDNCFDLIISTECFEHDPFYERTIKNIYRMLKPGGLFIFSCATTGRPEHGTRRTTPDDAPFIQDLGEWADYYKNLEEHDIRLVLDVDSCFKSFEFSTQNKTHDLYFWGVKTGDFQERNDYSFLMPDNSLRRLITKVRTEYEESERNRKTFEHELEISRSELKKIHQSHSWRLTKPMRFLARLVRGEFNLAFRPLIQSNLYINSLTKIRRVQNGLAYLARGDINGFRNRLIFLRKQAAFQKWQNTKKNPADMSWGIMTPSHTFFIAQLIADHIYKNGWACEVMTTVPKHFSHDLYIVICPQFFDRLPPGEKRISYQLEQSVSSRWFTDKYKSTLENSLAVLEYSLINLEYLDRNKITYPDVHYLPIGALSNYGEHVITDDKKFDVIFYGDSLSSPRRKKMLDVLQKRFNVHIVNNLFGDDMIRVLKQSKVVVNIHYYEDALLEMPRIQECLSLGLKVVSESSQDQQDYPELGTAVRFFDQGSIDGMIATVEQAMENDNEDAVKHSVIASQQRFTFMFNRFLVAMGFLPSPHVQSMELPVPSNADTFGLSLPETINRRRVFEKEKPIDCVIFDGIRCMPGWIGCGLSYAALARHALDHGMKSITVMEDDVVLPLDYQDGLDAIKAYLERKESRWDVFSGVIASLHPEAEVLEVEEFAGRTFVTINKMTSTVFNIYSESALKMFCQWDSENLDATNNTIDRYLEGQKKLRVVVMLPFFVGHREEMHSTLWGFQNTQYCEMIAESENLLMQKVCQVPA